MSFVLGIVIQLQGQTTICPSPLPGAPNCYQTSRPLVNNNVLTNHPPLPFQDCCNALPVCLPLVEIDNGIIIPAGAPTGVLFPGCVQNELPDPGNNCFSNNEKATTWYKFEIQPLPGGPKLLGSPAGKLRFKIIPFDALQDPDYDPFTDNGVQSFGTSDYDFLLFKIPNTISDNQTICNRIKNSPGWNIGNSVIASCNASGVRGPIGLFEPGIGTETSQGPSVRFNRPLNVRVGDLFYLAVENFSLANQGFQIDFRALESIDDSVAIIQPVIGAFTDSISQISSTSAKAYCKNITHSFCSLPILASGICWSTQQFPTVDLPTKTNVGAISGPHSSTMTGLDPATTYYARAYTTTSSYTEYGSQVEFTTLANDIPPALTTTQLTEITADGAVSGGNINFDGGMPVTAKGVCWSTSPSPTINLPTRTLDGSGTDAYSSTITGLQANTTYYVRAYATNSMGTGYGNEVSFNTLTVGNQTSFTEESIKVYPNPFTNELFVHVGSNKELKVVLCDILGKELSSNTIRGTQKLNMNTLSRGVYYLKIQEFQKYIKVIKEL
jgi:hypothetical protein